MTDESRPVRSKESLTEDFREAFWDDVRDVYASLDDVALYRGEDKPERFGCIVDRCSPFE